MFKTSYSRCIDPVIKRPLHLEKKTHLTISETTQLRRRDQTEIINKKEPTDHASSHKRQQNERIFQNNTTNPELPAIFQQKYDEDLNIKDFKPQNQAHDDKHNTIRDPLLVRPQVSRKPQLSKRDNTEDHTIHKSFSFPPTQISLIKGPNTNQDSFKQRNPYPKPTIMGKREHFFNFTQTGLLKRINSQSLRVPGNNHQRDNTSSVFTIQKKKRYRDLFPIQLDCMNFESRESLNAKRIKEFGKSLNKNTSQSPTRFNNLERLWIKFLNREKIQRKLDLDLSAEEQIIFETFLQRKEYTKGKFSWEISDFNDFAHLTKHKSTDDLILRFLNSIFEFERKKYNKNVFHLDSHTQLLQTTSVKLKIEIFSFYNHLFGDCARRLALPLEDFVFQKKRLSCHSKLVHFIQTIMKDSNFKIKLEKHFDLERIENGFKSLFKDNIKRKISNQIEVYESIFFNIEQRVAKQFNQQGHNSPQYYQLLEIEKFKWLRIIERDILFNPQYKSPVSLLDIHKAISKIKEYNQSPQKRLKEKK